MTELVDKKEVLKIIDNVPSDFRYWAITDGIIVMMPDAFDRLHKEIDGITQADVSPVIHAKWKVEDDDRGWIKHICTSCGYTKRTDVHVSLDWKYCPMCGAKMEW